MSSHSPAPSYHRMTANPIIHSDEIADGVVADFDATGGVVGIEFLNPALSGDPKKYVAIALNLNVSRRSPGRPPSASLRRAS